MSRFSLTFDKVATGAVADTYKTIAALIAANVAGTRCRLVSLTIGPSDAAPVDKNVAVKIHRIASVYAGSAGTKTAVTGANMGKADPNSADSSITGGRNYTVEPTAYDTEPLWVGAFNARGGLIKYWDEKDGPECLPDNLLGLLASPRDANAVNLSGTLEFETF